MKRYLLWIAAIYFILLLLPLPLLKKTKSDKAEPPSASSEQTSPSNNSTPQTKNVFRLLDKSTGTVYEVEDRDFIIGAVAAEMYPTYHSKALKAQAVASYTYYSVQRDQQRSSPNESMKGADLADKQADLPIYYKPEQLKERWGNNYDSYYKKIKQAVDTVFGKRMIYNGKPIKAVYHAISSGTTEDAAKVWGTSYPYLQPVASPGDKLSPSYQSIVTLSPDELSKKLSVIKSNLSLKDEANTWISSDIQTSSSGTVEKMKIGGVTFTGRQIREALGLRSCCFTVKYKDGNFLFTVLGYGHNVGMSQYGADYLARQGSSWEEILHYYYTGITIS